MARRGRPPKPHESILTTEQIAEIQSKGLTLAQQEAADKRKIPPPQSTKQSRACGTFSFGTHHQPH